MSAAEFGHKTALITDTRTLSFAELDELSSRVAVALHARGIRRGDRVAIYSANRWEWIVAYHGTLKSGAVVNPINVMLTPAEVRFVLSDCGASLLFAEADKPDGLDGLTDDVESLLEVVCFGGESPNAVAFDHYLTERATTQVDFPQVAPTEPSTIGYTSGTTGHPKGAVQTHQAVLLNCRATATMHARTAADVVVTALPAPHVYGNVAINSTFLAGGTVVLMERFDPAAALTMIQKHSATMFEGVPAMYSMMLAQHELATTDLSSLTRCTVGGQTIPSSTIEDWQRHSDAPLIELWGMTEISGLGTTHWADRPPVPGSIGIALPGAEVRVASLDDPAATADPGNPGELMIRGPLVMIGYFGNDEATAQAIEPDGWLHTGDVAYMDPTGYFHIVDRRKDMIITAGYNVYPAEIERVLAAHPAVAMVAVGPVHDKVKGELARAYVVRRADAQATEAELIDYCRHQLAAYKLPRSIRFVDHLPQTSTGKVMRRELRNLPGS